MAAPKPPTPGSSTLEKDSVGTTPHEKDTVVRKPER